MSDARTASAAHGDPRWLDALERRVSRRTYLKDKVDPTALDALGAVCESFRPYPDARVELVREADPGMYSGFEGAYWRFAGAPTLIAMVGAADGALTPFHVGYTGEGCVLEATLLGLSTCWVGAQFDASVLAKALSLPEGEKVWAVSPIGHAPEKRSGFERLMGTKPVHARKDPADITHGDPRTWPEWARAGLAAARIAPSAINRQPWRFRFEGGVVYMTSVGKEGISYLPEALDCGIAMLHFELAARAAGSNGSWESLANGSTWVWKVEPE